MVEDHLENLIQRTKALQLYSCSHVSAKRGKPREDSYGCPVVRLMARSHNRRGHRELGAEDRTREVLESDQFVALLDGARNALLEDGAAG